MKYELNCDMESDFEVIQYTRNALIESGHAEKVDEFNASIPEDIDELSEYCEQYLEVANS